LYLRLSRVLTVNTVVFASLFCVFVPFSAGAAQAQNRLRSTIDDSNTYVLKGNTRPAVASGLAQDVGAASASQLLPNMSLHFSLTAPQQADLTQLLAAQQNRRSPQYRKFLTPEEYADRFGLSMADVAKVTTWLETNGFSNVQAARSRTFITFSGSVAQAQSTFHTSIRSYSLNGEAHIANAADPELPKALLGVVDSVNGLNNFAPKALNVSAAASILPKPHYTTSGGTHYLTPDDWETIYDVKPLYSAGLNGSVITGETYSIAVVGQADISLTDLNAFRTAAGLAAKNPTVTYVGTYSSGLITSSDIAQMDLDLQWAGAIAPNANINYLVGSLAGAGVQDAIAYAIDHNVAPIISTSYGECEANLSAAQFSSQNALLQQAAAKGITVVAATGNAGAAACDTATPATKGLAVMFPASSQYVTAVGGTEFNPASGTTYFNSSNNANGGSAVSYIPEIAWNDGGQSATGGGVSTLVAKPTWQTGTGVPADGQRDIPDIALAASIQNTGFLYCNNSSCTNGFLNSSSSPSVTGGTSAGPPTFAGVLALLVQKTGARVGLLNSNLYSLAAISNTAFHDITGGNNQVPCAGGSTGCPNTNTSGTGEMGYSAGTGYDVVTGWGSIDSYNFVEQWSGDVQLTASPASLNIPQSSSSTSSVSVAAVNAFSGSVTFSCSVSSSISANVTCSIPNTPVTVPGSATVTITTGNLVNSFKPRRLFPTLPTLPPNSLAWLVVALAFAFTAYATRKYKLVNLRAAYVAIGGAFLALTVGAVSCGSGAVATVSMTCTLPEPLIGVPYLGGNCVGSGGKAPYKYAVALPGTGPLPSGLSLNTSTGAITGTPTAAGTFTFTIQIYDSSSTTQTITDALALTVQPALTRNGYVTVTATSGGIVNSVNIPVTTAF